jgi:hypothetical protein
VVSSLEGGGIYFCVHFSSPFMRARFEMGPGKKRPHFKTSKSLGKNKKYDHGSRNQD